MDDKEPEELEHALSTEIEVMKKNLNELLEDGPSEDYEESLDALDDDLRDDSAIGSLPQPNQLTHQQSVIADRYEHHHNPNEPAELFVQLIPDHQDKKNQWKRYLPITFWLPKYQWRAWFPYDLIAAITDIVMVIPQGMGYALVAGLQPINGLYSALMGHCLYSPFGTSGQLIVAPVAIVSLMTKETLGTYFANKNINDPDIQEQMAAYGSALAFQSGIICILLGLMQAGILANMLAEPVIVGFTFAAAILIGISQLTFIFQVEVHGEEVIEKLISFFSHISHVHLNSVILAICCVTFLLIIKYWTKSKLPCAKAAKFIPSALILVIIATVISYSNGLDTGFDIVGELPKGLPKPKNFFLLLESGDFWHLWVPSILITVLSFIESIAVATKFADKHDYSIDASQELLALGICNLVGCWFQIYPVSGVLSLATVVEAAGATTPLYGIIAGIGLIICCGFFLFLFEWLPKPVLGAIVLVGIMNLIDLHKINKLWKISRKDFMVMCITILVTLFLGIDFGVALGVVASIVLFIQKAAKPHYSVLGRVQMDQLAKTKYKLPTSPIYRNVKHYPSTVKRDDMLMIRWDASIFFGNTSSFKIRIRKQIGRHLEEFNYPKHWCLVLCFSGVNDVDFTGIEMLETFFKELIEKEIGLTIILCKLKTPVLNALTRGEIICDEIIPKDHILWELHEAEEWWDHQLELLKNQKLKSHKVALKTNNNNNKRDSTIPLITHINTNNSNSNSNSNDDINGGDIINGNGITANINIGYTADDHIVTTIQDDYDDQQL